MTTRRTRLRTSLLAVAVFAVVISFMVRLVDIQVVNAAEFNRESAGKRGQELVLYGARGDIVDTNGTVLAQSVQRFDITADPAAALSNTNSATVPVALADIAAIMPGADPVAMQAALSADPTSNFAYLARDATLEQYTAIRDLEIPWVYFESTSNRIYPNGATAGNIVGFIGTDGPQAGLELGADQCLAGTNGTLTYERGADNVRIPGSEVVQQQAKDGGALQLTIDANLQFAVQQRMQQTKDELGATWASAVVMRVSDGALLSVVDAPSIDPNDVNNVPVDGDGNAAYGSRAFSFPFEPGSIMKPLTAASLIDAGVATPASQVVAPYSYDLPNGGGTISDALWHPTQNLTLAGSIVESSNTATAQFSQLLSAEQRRQYMVDFGLGDWTESGYIDESAGLVPEVYNWDSRTTATVQFGQGMSATSIQMASVYQTLGNGGVRMPVTLVKGCKQADGTVTDAPSTAGRQVVSQAAADQTVNMMEMVAKYSSSAPNLQIPGYNIAVKSGTAQVAENGVYGDKAVISYAGLAPAENPQYVVLVSAGIPQMKLSGIIAPTFRDVMSQVLTTYRVPPSTTPANELPLTW